MTFAFWMNCCSYPNILSKCIENQYISISCRNISLHLKVAYLVPTEKWHVHFCAASLHVKNKKAQTILCLVAFSKVMPVIFDVLSFPKQNTTPNPDVPGFLGCGSEVWLLFSECASVSQELHLREWLFSGTSSCVVSIHNEQAYLLDEFYLVI